MKQIRSNIDELKKTFDQISIRHISEFNLDKIEQDKDGLEIQKLMSDKDFDVMPIISDEKIIGYVEKSELKKGPCSSQMKEININDVVTDTTPLLNTLNLFKKRDWLFILKGNEIEGIVTKSDLRKAPVRMYLFITINLLDMHLTRLIRNSCNDDHDELKVLIKKDRFDNAIDLLNQRRIKNEALDIFECLQLCDKREICLKKEDLIKIIDLDSKKKIKKFFNKLEDLRNSLAHGNDIVNENRTWIDVIDLTNQTEKIIEKCEGY